MTELLNQILTDDLLKIRAAYNRHGFDVRIVGGAVRDIMMGKSPKDVDLCTDASPDEQQDVCKAENLYMIPTGLQHGTITVIPTMVRDWREGKAAMERGDAYEITSLRTESDHDGRWATTDFTKDWVGDLARRDLTFNAMMLTFDGDLLDPFGGREDLSNGVVRFVGNAEDRIREDYLRILRFFRFNGRYGKGELAKDQATAIANNVEGFIKLRENGKPLISGERIWNEMGKILMGAAVDVQMAEMYRLGVAEMIALPVDQMRKQRASDLDYLASRQAKPTTALAYMLDNQTEIKAVQKRWSFTVDELKAMNWLVANKERELSPAVLEDLMVDGVDKDMVKELTVLAFRPWAFKDVADFVPPVFPVNGDMLMEVGFKPGKKMGDVLRTLKDEWKASRFTLDTDTMMTKAKEAL
jgi:tRNA nucleotidyltransferase/poly(A) polymerase